MSGEVGLPDRTAYCSSKFAVNGFFESLRIEMENKNIAITLICPPSVNIEIKLNLFLFKNLSKNNI